MQHIDRQKRFLNEWNNLTPYLKNLTQDMADECRKEITAYGVSQTTNTDGRINERE
jgi:hypothetical protein